MSYPLFPLQQCLLPGQRLALQIFEPRYLRLISDCLKADRGFGVVQIHEGREVGQLPTIYPVGTEAVIVDWYQQPDGLLGIEIEGCDVFGALVGRSGAAAGCGYEWLESEPVTLLMSNGRGWHYCLSSC